MPPCHSRSIFLRKTALFHHSVSWRDRLVIIPFFHPPSSPPPEDSSRRKGSLGNHELATRHKQLHGWLLWQFFIHSVFTPRCTGRHLGTSKQELIHFNKSLLPGGRQASFLKPGSQSNRDHNSSGDTMAGLSPPPTPSAAAVLSKALQLRERELRKVKFGSREWKQ